MPDLELALRDVGADLDWPAEPELRGASCAGSRSAPIRRRASLSALS
jgi:hypothetical protein